MIKIKVACVKPVHKSAGARCVGNEGLWRLHLACEEIYAVCALTILLGLLNDLLLAEYRVCVDVLRRLRNYRTAVAKG